jgi:two-component system LytT family response regulator
MNAGPPIARTVLIVDDEPVNRLVLGRMAEHFGARAFEASSGQEALEMLAVQPFDLVLMDIHMPGMSGIEFARHLQVLERPPAVIFVTAHDRYALKAFEVHALDYLLKPIEEPRFMRALERVRTVLSRERAGDLGKRLGQLLAQVNQPAVAAAASDDPIDRIPIKTRGRIVVVRVADIDWVEADGDYVTLHVGNKTWLLRETIAAAEVRLAAAGFVRIHRSTLVNADRVREMRPLSKGEFAIILADGTELKLSRNYRSAIARVAGTGL